MIKTVSIKEVVPLGDSYPPFIEKMKEVLRRQGQIEPLQVWDFEGSCYFVFSDDVHGNDIVYAARALGWDTLLISVQNSYEG